LAKQAGQGFVTATPIQHRHGDAAPYLAKIIMPGINALVLGWQAEYGGDLAARHNCHNSNLFCA